MLLRAILPAVFGPVACRGKWGMKENLIDAWHLMVYASGTVAGWVLLGHVV